MIGGRLPCSHVLDVLFSSLCVLRFSCSRWAVLLIVFLGSHVLDGLNGFTDKYSCILMSDGFYVT